MIFSDCPDRIYSLYYCDMDEKNIHDALTESYKNLEPFSDKYRVDFDRYVFSLQLLFSIPDLKNKKVLDVGTGIGLMPLALKKLGVQVAGLDRYIFPDAKNTMFEIKNVADLERLWKRNEVVVHNANIFDDVLPEDTQNVDVILSEATIEHLKDPKAFLQKCYNLLAPNGYILITTPNLGTLIKRVRFLLGKTPHWPIEDFFEGGENFTGHWREYTMKELVYMCEHSGFEVVNTQTKNMLAKFKSIIQFRKNVRAFTTMLSSPLSSMREMHYILCKKK